ncbi:MAG: acid phosphatase [Legionellaceae bacterium]|nr:acid phosphatase [Legionellaceae bacterium]
MKYLALKPLLILFFLFSSGFVVAEPQNIALLQEKIYSYAESGAYLREVNAVAVKADRFIQAEAKKNKKREQPLNLAIVLDIDETSLSNYRNIKKRQFVATPAQINQEILKADSPALEPVHQLYLNALQSGVKVFFVTGRNSSQEKATIKNLQEAGYTHWEGIYFRPPNYSDKSIVPFKAGIRKTICEMGYTILASIGDQDSDLAGGYAMRVYKLPNPFYYLG